MEHYPQHHNVAHHAGGSKKTTTALIFVAVVVVIVIAILLVTQTGTTEKTALIIENYDSISKGVVQYGDTATLQSNGYVALDLIKGEYTAVYELKQCSNPSEKFDYTRTSPAGETMSYNPLKEEVIVGANGKLQKRALTESEQISALTKEEVYVF